MRVPETHWLEEFLRKEGIAQEPERRLHAVPTNGTGHVAVAGASDPQLAAYLRGVIEGECAPIRLMKEHDGRNSSLNDAAFRMRSLVRLGHLTEEQVCQVIRETARICDLPEREVNQILPQAVRAGAAKHHRDPIVLRDGEYTEVSTLDDEAEITDEAITP